MSPEELIAKTAAPINKIGAVYYFHGDTLAAGKELGLDGFRFYMLGRGGVLGSVEPAVIVSAFGYFNPDVVTKIWNSAREIVDPRDAARAYLAANAKIGRAALAHVDGLAEFCEAAEQVIADLNPSALALYAGHAAEPLPEDLPARAMQLCVVHRELRGSIHLAAVVASGLDPVVAHAIKRPDDMELFGWTTGGVTIPDGAADVLAEAEALTDLINANAFRSLDDAQRQAFVDGTSAIAAAFDI